MSTMTPSRWLTALAIVAILILVLFIMGFWQAVYTPGAAPVCAAPFTLMEILALIMAIPGALLLISYLSRGELSAPNQQAAVDFLLLLFSPVGQNVLKEYGINPIVPGIVYGNYSAVPEQLRPFVVPLANVSYLSSMFPGTSP